MMKNDIIKMLANSHQFISGEEISKKLFISRSAVWKVIQTLKSDGAELDASPRNGYLLKKLPDVLKSEYLNVYLEDKPVIHWFLNIDSTNNYLKTLAANTNLFDIVAVAENQTGGKGRLGRNWESSPGHAIQMSFLIRPDIAPLNAGAYNFAVALGVCDAIKKVCNVDTQIKWPNDIVYNGKKLCGILTEMSTDMDRIDYLICGVGTNVNQEKFEGELKERATSLKIITGMHINRLKLCAAQISEIFKYFKQINTGLMSNLMEIYTQKSAVLGKPVKIKTGNQEYEGLCEGFGERGELYLKTDSGKLTFHAGEVSLRGADNYV